MVSTVVPLGVPAPGGRAVLDCSVLHVNERFEAWTEAVSQSFVPLAAEMKSSRRPAGFQGRLVSQSLGPAEINTVAGSAVSVRRSARSIMKNDPGFIKLGLQLRGYSVISQDDRDAALAPGDFAIYDTTRPYMLDFDESFEMFVVMFPAELLRFDRGTLATLTASRFSGRRGLGAVTSRFLGEISRQLDAEPLSGGLPLSDAVFDLLSATFAERLGPTVRGDEQARRRALTMQVESYMASRLGDPNLTVASVADAHHVSVRYLQKLFEQQHETVSGWIRHRRLEQARRDLGNPALAGRSVASIGTSWGFMDAAGFARAFRGEFGFTPSEFRAASLQLLERP
ncbi:Transcriptional regulator, AraC family [Microbacterium esteraromaticum]|uniref:Transcriptional regulator, AraC family n=1 Tax=Microbacterium esteraromaticum TaxID=57043 RepID=A0A1R4KBV6_9MICO|nr:helix-turn-helix domain-containing protein [Microbacterium esteraromaticum]SJN41642.1 Transcriptional regulator, AraC family [Microbacterium esteraromaticum]